MKRISLGRGALARSTVLLALGLAGCHAGKEPPYEQFVRLDQAPYVPRNGSGNAWDAYLIAAQEAADASKGFTLESRMKSGPREKFMAKVRPALDRAIRAGSLPCQTEFVVRDPFLPRPSHAGFSALGHALVFRIEAAATSGSVASAVEPTLAAHRLAQALAGGDCQDALLGYWIASRARAACAPLLVQMDAGTLGRLGEGILDCYDSDPEVTLTHEEQSMLAGVQFVQDAYRRKEFDLLETAMYKQARPAIEHLQNIHDGEERIEYFRGFAAEARFRAADAKRRLGQAAATREDYHPPEGERPWKRLTGHLFGSVDVYLEMRDRHLARSRLFALTCLAIAGGKSTGNAPAKFAKVADRDKQDPYTFQPLQYRVAGREFRLYSVGLDGRDDAGESDTEGLNPDLTIEPAEL